MRVQCVLSVLGVFGVKNEPFYIASSPKDTLQVSSEDPIVNDQGIVQFGGQEGALESGETPLQKTTPSPYVTVPVVFEYTLTPLTSALAETGVAVSVDDAVDNIPDIRALNSWLRTQSSHSFSI
jgi:hypothetical protein